MKHDFGFLHFSYHMPQQGDKVFFFYFEINPLANKFEDNSDLPSQGA